jgi:hypothetical protein
MSATSKVFRESQRADDALVVRDSESLGAWRQKLRTTSGNSHLPAVLFDFAALSDDQNRTLSVLANNYRKACGCASAGFFMSAAIVTTITAYFVFDGRLSAIGLKEVVTLAGIAFLALIFGKSWGLLWARWQLLRLASNLSGPVVGTAQGETS